MGINIYLVIGGVILGCIYGVFLSGSPKDWPFWVFGVGYLSMFVALVYDGGEKASAGIGGIIGTAFILFKGYQWDQEYREQNLKQEYRDKSGRSERTPASTKQRATVKSTSQPKARKLTRKVKSHKETPQPKANKQTKQVKPHKETLQSKVHKQIRQLKAHIQTQQVKPHIGWPQPKAREQTKQPKKIDVKIPAALVQMLRYKTGAGMMDCKTALVKTDGDMEAAADFLHMKELALNSKGLEVTVDTLRSQYNETSQPKAHEQIDLAKPHKEASQVSRHYIVRCVQCNQSINALTGGEIKLTCPVCNHSWVHDGSDSEVG